MNFKTSGPCKICGKPRGGPGHRLCSIELQKTTKPARRHRNLPTTVERAARFLATL